MKGRYHLGNLGIDERILLKLIFRKIECKLVVDG
jgi:hypothetical protein